MRKELRDYLNTIGLRADASEAEAWQFYGRLKGQQRDRAAAIRQAPPAAPPAPANTDPAADPQRQPADPPPQRQPADPPAPPANPTADPPADPRRSEAEIRAAERQRVEQIRQWGRASGASDELVERAIHEDWTTERAAEALLTALRDRPAPVNGGPGIHSRGHDQDTTSEALQGAMILRSGLALDSPHFRRVSNAAIAESTGVPLWLARAQSEAFPDEQARATALRALDMAHHYADMSMVDICREAIRLDGRQVPHSRGAAIRAAVSGGSLSNIFSTVVGAQLIEAYMAAPDSTMGWTREADVSDFKTQERTQLGKGSTLEQLPRGGTARHTTFSDRKESYRIARYARKFVVDEMDIIDDRFDALVTAPQELGEAAAQLRPDMVYALLFANAALDQDSVALFDSSTHANLRTSAGLNASNLEVALADMAIQQQDGRALNLFGKYLIIPQTLLWTARQLTQSATLIGQGQDAAPVGSLNPYQEDRLEIRADQRLDNGVTDPVDETTYSGATGDWFLAARGGRHTIEVGYLAGTGRSPQLRSFMLTEGQWGLGWDINHNLGAKALDFRGLHKNEE